MSLRRHDFVVCGCFKNEVGNKGIFIDGGMEYIRCGGDIPNAEEIKVKIQWY